MKEAPQSPEKHAIPASEEDPPTSSEGVDLTQIRELLAMTPTERVQALADAANALLKIRRDARKL